MAEPASTKIPVSSTFIMQQLILWFYCDIVA
jgi:hypothetical protein